MSNERIPSFCLSAQDAALLTDILTRYGPYSNGQTAVFWHVTGVIGNHRKEPDPEQTLATFTTAPAGPADEPLSRYSCFVEGCPGNHVSKYQVCKADSAPEGQS